MALIVIGAPVLFGSAEKGRLASLHLARYAVPENARRVIDEALEASAGGDVLVGIGAVVLGILALLGLQTTTLVLVGYLGVATVILLSGSSFGARIFGILRHAA